MQLLLSHELQVPGARCLAPDELRDHMEERFAWAVGRGHSVCVLVCDPLGLEGVERRNAGVTPRVLGTLAVALGPAFRASEAIVHREQGCLVVLLVGPDPLRMEAACREWIGGARELQVDGVGPLQLGLRIGYAVTQPGKRLFLDTLIQVAHEGLRVARCRGSGACVHTMLYDLLQNGLESERGSQGMAVTACVPLPPGAPAREPGVEGPGDEPRDPRASMPRTSGPERGSALADPERRERELAEALELQRRENDALRARLQALENRDAFPDGVSGTPEPLSAPAEDAQDRVDLLERRLAKLRLSLAEAEEQLARAALANVAEPGVASCYRTVQGLDTDTPHRALKAALMEKIFAANLELHESLGLRRAPTISRGRSA